ncbi:SCO family protein [Noviherbaspirillum massiliense]|uniref:SCO family protein n=1 Tax=Noviherbaspirillum massiliense TaxID=1465823 RepID=UPI0002D6772C|nr:SCO family protein [Noviherbaspirillum massiliense]
MKAAWLLVLWLMAGAAHAQARALPAPPQTEFLQQLDAALPLQSRFVDDDGRPVLLGDLFGARPVVLVLGYYHCPNLCSTVFEGVLQSLALAGLPPQAYRLVGVSIDPHETAEVAARKKAAYASLFGSQIADTHLLTGSAQEVARLTAAVGFRHAYDAGQQQYAHPAGFVIVTPQGRVARYFLGVRFDPGEVRRALDQASSGRIGSPVQRLLLLCAHYDPATGRYSFAAMTAVRIVCIAVLLLMAGWVWRQRVWRGRR